MEEITPPKTRAKWRNWIKPIVFTTLLYVGLGGVVYYFYGTQSKSPTNHTTATSPTPEGVAVPVVQDIATSSIAPEDSTSVVLTTNPNTQGLSNAQTIVPTNAQSTTGEVVFGETNNPVRLTLSNAPQNTRRIYQNNTAANHHPGASVQTDSVVPSEPMPVAEPTPPEPNPKEKALTQAEAEAEAQNELLREAINKVRQINDTKIAKARENITESSVPAHQPIIKEGNGADNSPEDTVKPKETPNKEKETVKKDPPKKENTKSEVGLHKDTPTKTDDPKTESSDNEPEGEGG